MNFNWIFLFIVTVAFSQPKFTVTGRFNNAPNKQIIFKGYNQLEDLPLGKTTTDASGNFTLSYPADYMGVGLLEIVGGKKIILLLNHEDFEVQWEDMGSSKTLTFVHSVENTTFDQGQDLYQSIQEKKAGITHLLPFYSNEPQKNQFFKTELSQLETTFPEYLKKIDSELYVGYYLRMKTFAADMQLALKRYPEKLPELLKAFTTIDFNDKRLLHSGLYEELFMTFVNAAMNRDNHYELLNAGADAMITSLKSSPELKQKCAEYLFNLLEKKSLFLASEHLALALLNDDSCTLDVKHKALFEQYRKMAAGKTAPDIVFENDKKSHLYELKNRYKLVVFGASWCNKCVEEIPKLYTFYGDWKKKYGLEIAFISLDTKKEDFNAFAKNYTWISSCDFKSWDSKPVIDYCVFATPTMYLLDSQNQILLKPVSAEQIKAWLEARGNEK